MFCALSMIYASQTDILVAGGVGRYLMMINSIRTGTAHFDAYGEYTKK